MSSGYRALLQSLDETEKDVSLGLGRSIKINKHKSCCGRCCCCCSRRGTNSCCMWTCFTIVMVCGLVISVGLPILLTVPVESSWHWTHWIHFTHSTAAKVNSNNSTNRTAADTGSSSVGSNNVVGGQSPITSPEVDKEAYDEDGNGTSAWPHPSVDHLGLPETGAGNTTVTFLHDAITHLQQMMEWTKEQYDKTPKIPLIIGLSALLLVILTIVWLAVYRKIRRRQRRRTLGKLVTDLQSGKTLLNSDDSEED